jgi:hypothetical protein
MTGINYDDGPIEVDSYLYGKISVWREIKALDIYTAKGFFDGDARWGHGETPEEAVKDLLRELSLKDVEDYEGRYELGGDQIEGPSSHSGLPGFLYPQGHLVPPIWIEGADQNLARWTASRKFYTAHQPIGTVIRIKGDMQTDVAPHGWVYEKFSDNEWNTTYMDADFPDHDIQREADEHGFDLLYIPEVTE